MRFVSALATLALLASCGKARDEKRSPAEPTPEPAPAPAPAPTSTSDVTGIWKLTDTSSDGIVWTRYVRFAGSVDAPELIVQVFRDNTFMAEARGTYAVEADAALRVSAPKIVFDRLLPETHIFMGADELWTAPRVSATELKTNFDRFKYIVASSQFGATPREDETLAELTFTKVDLASDGLPKRACLDSSALPTLCNLPMWPKITCDSALDEDYLAAQAVTDPTVPYIAFHRDGVSYRCLNAPAESIPPA